MAHSINTQQQRTFLPVSDITTILPEEPLKLIIKSLGPVPARGLALSCKFFNHLCKERLDELFKIWLATTRATNAVIGLAKLQERTPQFAEAFFTAVTICRENAGLLDQDVKQKLFSQLAASLHLLNADYRFNAINDLAACLELLPPDCRAPFINQLWMRRKLVYTLNEVAIAEKILWAALVSVPEQDASPTRYGWRASAFQQDSGGLSACMLLLQEIRSLDGSGLRKNAVLAVLKNLGRLLRTPDVTAEIVRQAGAIADGKAEILQALLQNRRSFYPALCPLESEAEEQEGIRVLELVWAQLDEFDDHERTALLKETLLTAAQFPDLKRIQCRAEGAKHRVVLSEKGQAEVLGVLMDDFRLQYMRTYQPLQCQANDRVLLTDVLRELATGLANVKATFQAVRVATMLPSPDYDSVMALLWRRIAQLRPSDIKFFLGASHHLSSLHETARRSAFLTQLLVLTKAAEVDVPDRFWETVCTDLKALPEQERPAVTCDLLRALAARNKTALLQQAFAEQLETFANDQVRLAWCERLIQAAQKPGGRDAIHGAPPSPGATEPLAHVQQVTEVLVILAEEFRRMMASDAWLHLFKQLVAAAVAMAREVRPVLLWRLARLATGDAFQACFKLLTTASPELRPQDQFQLWATLGANALACGDKEAFKQVLKLSASSGKPRSELLAAIADLPGTPSQVVQPQAAFVLIKEAARLPAAERTPLLSKLATSGLENQLRALQAESAEKGGHAASVKDLEAPLLKLFYELVEQAGNLDKPLRRALLLDLARQVPKLPENERNAATMSLWEMAAKISPALKNQILDVCAGTPGH